MFLVLRDYKFGIMIIQLKNEITSDQKDEIINKLHKIEYSANEVTTQVGSYLIGIGKSDFDIRELGFMPGIADIHIVSDNYKLVSRKWKVDPSPISLSTHTVPPCASTSDLTIANPTPVSPNPSIRGRSA